jgi:CheY-like chemotaxis protein
MGIQGNASLMLLDIDADHPHYARLKSIEQQVQAGAELTRQLLGAARGGKYEVRPTDINRLVEGGLDVFGRTNKDIIIHKYLQEAVWTVEVDKSQIEQVLLNIYINARQAMPGSGDLYVETKNIILDEDYVGPFGISPGKFVRISVTDTGTGMDEITQKKAFDPFFTTKKMGRGTGLGLASAYGIIKNHNGIINIYSEKGEGTTLKIYLPVSDKDVVKEAESQVEIIRGAESILYVDDQQPIVDVGRALLESMGYRVITAMSGKEAMEIYSRDRDRIDLIILDMIMPGLSGGDTFDQLKKIDPQVKVLLSSGYSINGQARAILDRGCNGFIQKPFSLANLSKKVRQILDGK